MNVLSKILLAHASLFWGFSLHQKEKTNSYNSLKKVSKCFLFLHCSWKLVIIMEALNNLEVETIKSRVAFSHKTIF